MAAHVGALALLLQIGALAEQPSRLAGLALYLGQQLAADEGVAAPHRLHLHSTEPGCCEQSMIWSTDGDAAARPCYYLCQNSMEPYTGVERVTSLAGAEHAPQSSSMPASWSLHGTKNKAAEFAV